jgi:hypothetical protein
MHDGCCLLGCLPRVVHPGPPPRRCTTPFKTSIPLNPLTQCPRQKCPLHPSQKQSSSRTSRPYPWVRLTRGPPPEPAARRLSTSWLLLAIEITIEDCAPPKAGCGPRQPSPSPLPSGYLPPPMQKQLGNLGGLVSACGTVRPGHLTHSLVPLQVAGGVQGGSQVDGWACPLPWYVGCPGCVTLQCLQHLVQGSHPIAAKQCSPAMSSCDVRIWSAQPPAVAEVHGSGPVTEWGAAK